MTRPYTRTPRAPGDSPAVEMPETAASIEATNPANSSADKDESFSSRRRRIPMNVPRRKLETQELPGFYLHWINGEPSRIAQAMNAGYDFVQKHEMPGYTLELGDKTGISEDGGMGGGISVLAGGTNESDGKASRLYLMKLPMELREEDLEESDAKGQQVIDALLNDPNANPARDGDNGSRYLPERKKVPPKPKSLSYNALDAFQKRR